MSAQTVRCPRCGTCCSWEPQTVRVPVICVSCRTRFIVRPIASSATHEGRRICRTCSKMGYIFPLDAAGHSIETPCPDCHGAGEILP